jgi:hypothetical protein
MTLTSALLRRARGGIDYHADDQPDPRPPTRAHDRMTPGPIDPTNRSADSRSNTHSSPTSSAQ